VLKIFSNFAIKANPVKLILYFLDRNVMAINDIHEFVDSLEKAGELKRVKTEVALGVFLWVESHFRQNDF